MGFLSDLKTKHPEEFKLATTHKFLDQCGAGTLPKSVYRTWLTQDYIFSHTFVRLVAATLVTTPPDDQELFIGGLSLIVDEKEWFRSEHAKEGLDPSDTVVKSQNREFIEWMAAKAASPRHADRAVALWAIESSYGHAWGDASPFAPPFDVTSQIWVSDSFKTYLREIERAAEDAIAAEGDGARERAEQIFLDICRLERNFWEMTYESD